jgi:hypothetical protein
MRVMVVFQRVSLLDKTSSTLCGGSFLSPAWSVSCIATLYKFWALINSGFGLKDHGFIICIRTQYKTWQSEVGSEGRPLKFL